MLSYRHSFHAGNYADVLKHLVLQRILHHLTQKEKPLLYLDTHAGAGGYLLDSAEAGKTREYEGGVGRLWVEAELPPALGEYRELVRRFNGDGPLRRYPGSPWFAQQLLRPQDRLVLRELHPSDFQLLQQTFRGDKRCRVEHEDGFQACSALLPPPERRGLVLIDPPYEVKEDYQRVVDALLAAHRRFATGSYAIWYPVVERYRIERMEKALVASGIRRILLLELGILPDSPGRGMTASGMVVVNPPWQLAAEMAPLLDYLAGHLADQGRGHSRLVELAGE